MAAKLQLLVVAALTITTLAVNDSNMKKPLALDALVHSVASLAIDPKTAQDVASAFEEALGEENALLKQGETDSKANGKQQSLMRTHLRATRAAAPIGQLPQVGKPLAPANQDTSKWASDFERDVSALVAGLAKGGRVGKDFGNTVKKIHDLIDNDMIPKVLEAHKVEQIRISNVTTNLGLCDTTEGQQMAAANALSITYDGDSKKHVECRKNEQTRYDENVETWRQWREAKADKELKCAAFLEKSNLYGEQNKNQDIVKRAASEDVETYLTRISDTICGTPLDCSSCGSAGGGADSKTGLIGFLADFLAHKKACEDATAKFNKLTIQAKATDLAWHEQRAECDNLQDIMDAASCKSATAQKETCEVFEGCYRPVKDDYEAIKPQVVKDEADRQAEWRGLKKMKCMIDAFEDMEVQQSEVDFCKNEVHDTSHLNLKYPVIPIHDPCSYSNLFPNTDAYKAKEYAILPEFARGKIDSNECAGLNEMSTMPAAGSPASCKCTRIVMNGPWAPGGLLQCVDCLDVYKTEDANSCPSGTKLFSPRSRMDWETLLKSVDKPLRAPNWIVDVTRQADGCVDCGNLSVMNSGSDKQVNAPMNQKWKTSDLSPWWLRSSVFDTYPSSDYLANCFMDVLDAAQTGGLPTDADSITFKTDNCNYHSKSYYCQPQDISVAAKEGSPEGCMCKKVELVGTYSAGVLLKCENCLDVYKSLDKNSCPSGTKIFSPRTSEDWKTFIASAKPLRSPHWIIDVTRPQNGCGGCTESAMNSVVPASATWATSDGSPWWLRSTAYSQPNGDGSAQNGDYTANCFMDLTQATNAHAVMFDDSKCNYHSRSYYCQSVKTTTTTTTTAVPTTTTTTTTTTTVIVGPAPGPAPAPAAATEETTETTDDTSYYLHQRH